MPLIRQETPVDLSRETLERLANHAYANYNKAFALSSAEPTTGNAYTTAWWDGYLCCLRQLREMEDE